MNTESLKRLPTATDPRLAETQQDKEGVKGALVGFHYQIPDGNDRATHFAQLFVTHFQKFPENHGFELIGGWRRNQGSRTRNFEI